jgi:uncharacterized protein YbaP (TraB family)
MAARLIRALAALLACLPAVAPALPLWEIEGSGGRVWLLGSVHFLRADDYPLPPALDRVLAAADVIYLELDLDDPAAADPAVLTRLAIDPAGRQLPELIGSADWEAARRKAAALDLDLATLAPFEPWYAALAITQLRLAQLGFAGDQGVEGYVVRTAAGSGTEIRGLETLAGQLEALDGLSPAAQRRFLATTLDDAATLGDEIDAIIAAWRRGDTAALEETLLADLAAEPEVYRRVVVARNDRFLAQVRRLAASGDDVLVVVGTLHLVGADGLLTRLESAGLRPRRVR